MMAIEWSFSILAVTLVPIIHAALPLQPNNNALKACDNAAAAVALFMAEPAGRPGPSGGSVRSRARETCFVFVLLETVSSSVWNTQL